MGFWSSLFGGSNPTLSKDMDQFGQIGGFASGLGEKNLTQASNFWSSILSGDQGKQAKVLAPEINSLQKSAQQQRNATAQFGNRSGGNNAAMQALPGQTRANVNDLTSSLLSSSASNLGSSGSNLLSQGMGAYSQQAELSQQQMQNWANSILGMGVTSAIGAGESFALGKI